MNRRWWALGAMVASMLVLGFDTTILNVALPTLAKDLGASTGQQQWMADVYVVVFAALMLPAGLLGDRFGRRRMLIAGLCVFLAGSVVGALVHSVALVIAARGIMGVGAALIMPLSMAIVPSLFGEAKDRAKAVAVVSAGSALGMPLGPIIGGWLLGRFWWGSIFVLNVPMVAIGIAACALLLPETRDSAAPRVDFPSSALTALGFGALVFGIVEAPERGWGSAVVPASLAAAVLLLAALVLRERCLPRPTLDVTLLRDRGFLLPTLAATLTMFVLGGLLFLLPNYFQAVLGNGTLGSGVRLLPVMGGLMAAARGSGHLVRRFGPRGVIAGGLVLLAFATLLGAGTKPGYGYGYAALWMSVAGVGIGCAMIPAMDGALATVAKDRAGSGSGLLLTLRQFGTALGIALLGSLLSSAYTGRLPAAGLPRAAAATAGDSVVGAHLVAARLGLPRLASAADAAYVHGLDVALGVCAITALAAALLVAVLLRRPAAPAGAEGADHDETDVAPASRGARQ